MREKFQVIWNWLQSLSQKIQSGFLRFWTVSKAGFGWLKDKASSLPGWFLALLGMPLLVLKSIWGLAGLWSSIPKKISELSAPLTNLLPRIQRPEILDKKAGELTKLESLQATPLGCLWTLVTAPVALVKFLANRVVFTRIFAILLMVVLLNSGMNAAGSWWAIQMDQRAYDASVQEQDAEFECDLTLELGCPAQHEIWKREHPDQ